MAGTSSGPFDPEGLSTVPEVPHYKTSHDSEHTVEHRSVLIGRVSGSQNPSINSSFARSYNDSMVAEPPPVPYTTFPRKTRHARRLSDGKLKKADRRNTVGIDYSNADLAQRPRRSGLRNTIRRMFGRRSMKDRISIPGGTVQPRHVSMDKPWVRVYTHSWIQNPEEFITTAANVPAAERKVERSASLPTNAFVRSSGLSSHPPFQPPAMPAQTEAQAQRSSEETIPMRPSRPSREGVPSTSFTKEDLQAVTNAMSGIGLPSSEVQNVDARNIGFAVTNGSNPKRRSRSVGAFRQGDHRMSPIQWRHQRTKSDEFLYYRGSKETPEKPETNLDNAQEGTNDAIDTESQEGDFNFELQEGSLQDNERIGLEERLVTLEIKLMDLEFALSKVQAGSTVTSQRTSKRVHNRQESTDTTRSTEAPSELPPGSPLAPSTYSTSNRPTSVATTLKAGHNPHNSFYNPSGQIEQRLSLSGLTIEHYTTLVTLIRREQSARMRLEEQLSQLQQKFESSQALDRSPQYLDSRNNHHRDLSSSSHLSRFGAVNDDGRRRAKYYLDARPRSSSYSTNETDTEDDYHDAYVTPTNMTPVERGEYEAGALNRIPGVEEGEAF